MGKKFSLPKKKSAKEELSFEGADLTPEISPGQGQVSYQVPVTNFRRDFEEQAKQLREKIVIGTTPVRVEHPKNEYTLDSKGYLKGKLEAVKDGTGKGETLDLTDKAKAVNEGVKKPVFKRKSAKKSESDQDAVLAEEVADEGTKSNDYGKDDECTYVDGQYCEGRTCETCDVYTQYQSQKGDGAVMDERESTDKQPTEAVACETSATEMSRPPFNRMEQDFVNSGDSSKVRAAIASGELSKIRGHQILFAMGAKSASEDVEVPMATDKGKPVAQSADEADTTAEEVGDAKDDTKKEESAKENLEGIIDSEIGDEFDCDVVYSSKSPIKGHISRLSKEAAEAITAKFASIGMKSRTLSAKEGLSVLFEEESDAKGMKWYAIVSKDDQQTQLSQVTLTTNEGATKEEVTEYLKKTYGADRVLQVSDEKLR